MKRPLSFRNLLVPVSDNAESERAMDAACRLAYERWVHEIRGTGRERVPYAFLAGWLAGKAEAGAKAASKDAE